MAPPRTFGNKPIVEAGRHGVFPEIAVVHQLRREGWDAVWASTFGGLRFFDEQPNATRSNAASLPEHISARLEAIAEANGGWGGTFDVIAWKGDQLLFTELKRAGHDRIRDTQRRWLSTALSCGFVPNQFQILEWDFETSPAPASDTARTLASGVIQIAGTPIDMGVLMSRLAHDRPAFHSEADFQHAFAWAVHGTDPRLQARLEIPLMKGEHLDLLIADPDSNQRTAVEFKYPTAAWEDTQGGEEFSLRHHSATDLISYDILKDIQRLERLVTTRKVDNGLLVVLTNDPAYWHWPTHGRSTNADAFRVHEGITLTGTRDWGPRTGKGTRQGRDKSIELHGTYEIAWHDYARLDGTRGLFRWFALQVLPADSEDDPSSTT